MSVKADGKGMSSPKETSPQNSVDGEATKKAPGGESGSGSWIKQEGPNAYKKGK